MENLQDYVNTYNEMVHTEINEMEKYQDFLKRIGLGKKGKDINLIWVKDSKIFGYFEGWNFKPLGNDKSTIAALTKMNVVNDEVNKKQQADVALMVKMAKANGECSLKKS